LQRKQRDSDEDKYLHDIFVFSETLSKNR
jgi:hypothetical protein